MLNSPFQSKGIKVMKDDSYEKKDGAPITGVRKKDYNEGRRLL